jgi:hypothetical protein
MEINLKTNKIMKNIHILPTWQPSRLVIDTIENKLSIQDILHEKTINILPQNLFITSDEEIKEGDFFYSVRGVIEKAIINYPKGEHFGKLILTTDQNLIKYGVQAIDDEFLEWFVKNPSCEEVEIDKMHLCIQTGLPCGMQCLSKETCNENINYKIIIPKEEPKQDRTCTNNCSVACGECQILESKQETLEEAAEKWFNKDGFYPDPKQGFISGAKWQAKKSYSEEDLKEAYFSAIKSTGEGWNGEYANGNNPNIEDKFSEGFKEWFEQFKNK